MSEPRVKRRIKELMAEWATLRFALSEQDAAEAWAESMALHEAADDAEAAARAEAGRLALKDVAERVRGLPDGSLANSHGGAVLHGLVSRDAVLALLSDEEEAKP